MESEVEGGKRIGGTAELGSGALSSSQQELLEVKLWPLLASWLICPERQAHLTMPC